MLRPLLLLLTLAAPAAAESPTGDDAVPAATIPPPDEAVDQGDRSGRRRLGARVYFDPAATAETDARAAIAVARGPRIAEGRLRGAEDPDLSRLLAELCRTDLRHRDAVAAEGRLPSGGLRAGRRPPI
jgi:hypothetical protein